MAAAGATSAVGRVRSPSRERSPRVAARLRASSSQALLQVEVQQEVERRLIAEQEKAEAEAGREQAAKDLLNPLPHFSRYCRTSNTELPPDGTVAAYLRTKFLESVAQHRPSQGAPHCNAPLFDVLRIESIHVPRLQDKYLAEVQDEAGLCERSVTRVEPSSGFSLRVNTFPGMDMNEFLLFHGAPSSLFDRLMKQGLDPRYAGTHFGKLFGVGAYLASNSSKSDIYTEPNDVGERVVLVVRACLGEPHFASGAMRDALKPPERPDGRGPLTSVVAETIASGGVVEHPEFIVYDKSKVLPQFAIWYKHKPACYCTHCVRSKICIRIPIANREVMVPRPPLNQLAPSTLVDIMHSLFDIHGIEPHAQRISLQNQVLSSHSPIPDFGCVLELQPKLCWRERPALPPHRAGCITVHIRLMGQESVSPCPYQAPARTTIAGMKNFIASISAIAVEKQRIIFRGRDLPDGTLADSRITDGSSVHLSIRP